MDIRTIISVTAVTALTAVLTGPSLKSQPDPTQETGKKFAILFYETEQGFADRSNAKAEKYWASWMGYIGGIQGKGIVESGSPLLPPTEGRAVDGSGTTKLSSKGVHLSGMLVVKAGSLQEAVDLTKGCPALTSGGKVEVREVMPNAPKMEAVR